MCEKSETHTFTSTSHIPWQANQKKMVEYITAGSVKKVERLLESGVDPNFVTDSGSKPIQNPGVGVWLS